ncbi:hypothetical protein A0H81_14043 [Grifola frondosa]|uniref:Uncharacterized protein n=1 Tax=Grifola frondosa TaxID=5627 RepID=A0A1C7LML6_GRIFR|nr:hypothetical protein A0H81_14043 [Grifola frondosa]
MLVPAPGWFAAAAAAPACRPTVCPRSGADPRAGAPQWGVAGPRGASDDPLSRPPGELSKSLAFALAAQDPDDPQLQASFRKEVEAGVACLHGCVARNESVHPTLLMLSAVAESADAQKSGRTIDFKSIREEDGRIAEGWRAAATAETPADVGDLGENRCGKEQGLPWQAQELPSQEQELPSARERSTEDRRMQAPHWPRGPGPQLPPTRRRCVRIRSPSLHPAAAKGRMCSESIRSCSPGWRAKSHRAACDLQPMRLARGALLHQPGGRSSMRCLRYHRSPVQLGPPGTSTFDLQLSLATAWSKFDQAAGHPPVDMRPFTVEAYENLRKLLRSQGFVVTGAGATGAGAGAAKRPREVDGGEADASTALAKRTGAAATSDSRPLLTNRNQRPRPRAMRAQLAPHPNNDSGVPRSIDPNQGQRPRPRPRPAYRGAVQGERQLAPSQRLVSHSRFVSRFFIPFQQPGSRTWPNERECRRRRLVVVPRRSRYAPPGLRSGHSGGSPPYKKVDPHATPILPDSATAAVRRHETYVQKVLKVSSAGASSRSLGPSDALAPPLPSGQGGDPSPSRRERILMSIQTLAARIASLEVAQQEARKVVENHPQ